MLPATLRFRLFLPALGCLFACSHTQPFTPADTGTDQPWDPGPPARLTVYAGQDGQMSFTPDGRFLLYTLRWAPDFGCLALLPVHRARDISWICPVPPDSYTADGYSQPALSSGGRLAFVFARQIAYQSGLSYHALLVAPLVDLRDTAEVTYIPFMTPDGARHVGIDRAAWLNEDTLAIQADSVLYLADLTVRPRRFSRITLPGVVHSIEAVPGGGRLYLTLEGDSRVLVWDPEGGLTTLFDFGAAVPAIVQVGDREIAALTDSGLAVVDLSDGRVTPVPTYGLQISELALAPDGSDLIAAAVDSTVSQFTNLYRLAAP